MLSAAWHPARWGLVTRIVATSLVLLLVVQVAGFSVVRASIDRNARQQIAQELASGERVWQRLLAQNAERLRQGSGLLASDFGFRAAVTSGDVATIASALSNQGERIGATVTAFLNTRYDLVTVGDAQQPDASLMPQLQSLAQALAQDPQGSTVAVLGNTPFQFVMVPLRAPLVVGWVLMGFPMGQALVDDLHELLPVHGALVVKPNGQSARVVVSSLSEAERSRIDPERPLIDLALEEDTLLARVVQMPAVGGEARAVMYRSVGEVTAPFKQLQVTLAVITLMGVFLFGLSSAYSARRTTTPLRSLLQATRRLGQGRYDEPMAHTARMDEIGDLARAFDRMRLDIAAQQHEIKQLAYWDRLTGLPNRTQFRQSLQAAIDGCAQPLDTPEPSPPAGAAQAVRAASTNALAVVVLNLDRFKHVNDVMGHGFGDRLLCAVAQRLRQRVQRPTDLVARLGGDEFAVLLRGVDAAGATALAQALARAFDEHLAIEDQTVDLSAGLGIACWPAHGTDADTLMGHAEVAMHAAKRKTAGVLVYDPSLDTASSQTLSLLTELRQALAQGELRLYLQPKVTLADNSVRTAEALVRWQHPVRGLVPPMDFIPFAEQTGFIRQLTRWVFAEAARQWSRLQGGTHPLKLAINLSTRDLLDPDFPNSLAAVLREHHLSAESFVLEITESAIMDDPKRAEQTLNELADQGFKLSIDDFGTGYSSLAYLRRLPVQELKIDKSFVMGMADNQGDAKIVRSTIDLAHNLGLSVVAEGVETAAIMAQLAQWSCDEGQGYHLSRPIPLADFVAWRTQWEARQQALVS